MLSKTRRARGGTLVPGGDDPGNPHTTKETTHNGMAAAHHGLQRGHAEGKRREGSLEESESQAARDGKTAQPPCTLREHPTPIVYYSVHLTGAPPITSACTAVVPFFKLKYTLV